MTEYGLTLTGFVRKSQDVILAEIEADQRAEIDPDLDLSESEPLGQVNGIFARHLGIGWETLETVANNNDPDATEGRFLDSICKITGTFRPKGTQSEVVLSCNLDSGTELAPDDDLVAIEGQEDVEWTPKEAFTAPSDGVHSVTFVSVNTGPIPGYAGTITVIKTAKVGWNSVNNSEDATLGTDVMTDLELRIKRERDLANAGSATVRAILANLSTAFGDDLGTLNVYENDTDVTDDDGRPPHSVEAILDDGGAIDDDEIAQVILESRAAGVASYGTSSGTATRTINGVSTDKTEYFSRPDDVDIYIEYTLTTGTDYVGDTAVKEFVVATANAKYKPGTDVVALLVEAMVLELDGVIDVTDFAIGTAPSPTLDDNIEISIREKARFDTSRITVTS